MADLRKELLRDISDYCKATGLSPSTVCGRAANKRDFDERLKNGADITTKTYERVKQWFRDNPAQNSKHRISPQTPASP